MQKWDAVVKRICELNDKGVPVLVGTRSVLASEEVSRRLTEAAASAPGAERQPDRAGSVHRAAGRPARTDHGRDEHGRPRHRHQAGAQGRRSSAGCT